MPAPVLPPVLLGSVLALIIVGTASWIVGRDILERERLEKAILVALPVRFQACLPIRKLPLCMVAQCIGSPPRLRLVRQKLC